MKLSRSVMVALLLVGGCGGSKTKAEAQQAATTDKAKSAPVGSGTAATTGTGTATGTGTGTAAGTGTGTGEGAKEPVGKEPVAPAEVLVGQDFAGQALALFAVAACAPGAAIPSNVDTEMVAKHCETLHADEATYHKKWLDVAMPFLANIVPKGLPTTLVYPFGGGDLLTALATYPDATEITSISLEGFGDPRAIEQLDAKQLKAGLKLESEKVGLLLKAAYNRTWNLNDVANSELPGLLIFALVALDVHGYEPLSLRYFRFEADGSLHYLTAEEVAASDAAQAESRKKKQRKGPKQVQVGTFNSAELRFRKRGDASAPIRIYRHVTQDLSDKALTKDPGLLLHLAAKGRVSAITKAAHYLLWHDGFAKIRDYLLANMDFMISDDSGIPNRYVVKAGFVQETYGKYAGAFGHPSKEIQAENVELWKKNPYRALPFVFGYPAHGLNHLMLTRPANPPSAR